ncbi:MAG: TlyA family RNA methyltransferase [Burkholderiaceae bacterium]
MRADRLLVARGLAGSRTLAQRLIEAGRVRADDVPVRKPSDAIGEHAMLTLAGGDEDRFVSRGGLKLAGALARTGVDPRGRACLDIGQSTGGFTDCLLQAGAAHVTGVDVGHGQLAPRLAGDARVTAIEGVNARALDTAALEGAMASGATASGATSARALTPGGFGLVVIDVSFISLAHVLGPAFALAAPGAVLLALAKPQFEVGREGLDRRGLVRSPALYDGVRESLFSAAARAGWRVLDWFDSPIAGGDGNREFFLHARRPSPGAPDTNTAQDPR